MNNLTEKWKAGEFEDDIKEVLTPVPSYQELQRLESQLAEYKEENTRLKEDIDILKKNCEFNHKCLDGSRKKNTELMKLLK